MELESLLQAIAGQSPCGVDLSFSAEFDHIQEARRFDDPHLSQGEWVAALKEADWPAVVSSCVALLTTRTKDLRVAVWLAEALAKTRGFAGLAQGYTVLVRLCEQYWDDLHPLPEDGDPALRAGCLAWLLAQSGRIIRELPLTDPERSAYSSIDLEVARAASRSSERAPQLGDGAADDGRVTLARFEAARAQTSITYYRDSVAAASAALVALNTLERLVADRLAAEGPGFGGARAALEAVIDTLRRFAAEADVDAGDGGGAEVCAVAAPEDAAGAARVEQLPLSAPGRGTAPRCAAIHSRAQALDQLRQVADYFRRTEPHSPVAYLADKAAHWGEMPLHEWLRAVLKDDGTLSRVEELLGVELNHSS